MARPEEKKSWNPNEKILYCKKRFKKGQKSFFFFLFGPFEIFF